MTSSAVQRRKRVLAETSINVPLSSGNKKAKKAKKATKKSLTQAQANEKLKWATKVELVKLFKNLIEQHLDAIVNAVSDFAPRSAPILPMAKDPLLLECFVCENTESLHDFGGANACSECIDPKVSFLMRDRVKELFDLTPAEIKKFPAKMCLVHEKKDIIKGVNKVHGSVFNFVARRERRSPTPTGELYKAAPTPAKKKKVLTDVLKYSTQQEIVSVIKTAISVDASLKDTDGILAAFVPQKLPIKPSTDDLFRCCFCGDTESLQAFHDVKVCRHCDPNGGIHAGTLTRDRVMSMFHFSKSEADKIKRRTMTGGFYNSKIYVYNVTTVVAAAKKKHGSLYSMLNK